MRRRIPRRRAPLWLLLLCAPLLLSTSQVGSDPMPASAADAALDGAVCEAVAPVGSLSLNDQIADLAAAGALPQGDPDVVVLNGRGYNYGPPPDRELEMLRIEMLREQALERAR